jgi:hypothetical protein
MWRCYEPANLGGEAPEGTSGDQLYDAHGGAVFKRAPIAGLPFASNVADDGGTPIAVCTPALHNRAERLGVALAGVPRDRFVLATKFVPADRATGVPITPAQLRITLRLGALANRP